jgi:ferredoxin-type protein NapF
MKKISRAQFLRGDWGGDKPTIYPPWALAGNLFAALCDGCGDCIQACPRKILKLSVRGLALVDFSRGDCTFCGDCAAACPTGAIRETNGTDQQPWRLKAEISGECLAINGTSCVRCIESCLVDAIVARPGLRGRVQMRVDETACTGCGACFAPCPVEAVSMRTSNAIQASKKEFSGEHDESFVHQ